MHPPAPSCPRASLLVSGGFIYTADPNNRVLPDGWIHVVDDTIVAIGRADEPPPPTSRVLDARGKLVLPGLVNPHWHESFVAPPQHQADDRNIVRSAYADGGNIEALGSMFGFIAGVGERLTPDEAQAIARYSLWTQLRSGTTAIGDVGSANTADALARAAIDLGMRIRVSRWGSDICIRNHANTFERIADAEAQARDWDDLLSRWHDHESGLVGGMPSVMGAFASSDEQLRALADVVSRYDVPYATHLAPLRNERAALERVFGLSAVRRFAEFGLLAPKLLSVHTAYVDECERQLLYDTKVHLCHAPAHYGLLGEATISETKFIGELIRDGASVSSSSDGDVDYIGGMPEVMRATMLSHNEVLNDNTACPPTTALRCATIHGAQALGWERRIGSLERGKQADFVLVEIDDWRYRTSTHPLRTFLLAGGSHDVHTVVVAGRIVVEAGASPFFDEPRLFADYQRAAASARLRLGGPA